MILALVCISLLALQNTVADPYVYPVRKPFPFHLAVPMVPLSVGFVLAIYTRLPF